MAYFDIDLKAFASNAGYFSTLPFISSEPAISLLSYHPDFVKVVGSNATGRKIAEELAWEPFHESGIYNKKDKSLYVTSNYQTLENNINVTVVSLEDYTISSTHYPDLIMANGGTAYYPPGSDTLAPPLQVYCSQGDYDHVSSLVVVDPNTNKSEILLNNFMGRNFSSINDVRQHPETGDLFFTDADYGFLQDFRPPPTQPKQVYRFEPATGVINVIADGFVQSNGLEFSPDFKTMYVSDTGSTTDPTKPSTIYAFDVVDQKRLVNRRMFAFIDTGFPDGIHCDTEGNVWASAGDGVHVWNPEGIMLGKIFIGEMSNNFAFAPGKVFVFSNHRLWVVENVKAMGREVCKDFGEGC